MDGSVVGRVSTAPQAAVHEIRRKRRKCFMSFDQGK